METRLEKFALNAIEWVGSIKSLLLHTFLFVGSFLLYFLGVDFDKVLLVVTTIVSLEAIYLAIFIQMSVNLQSKKLVAVAQDVEEIQENVDEIQENVDEIQENVDDIQENVDEIQKDVEEIQKDVEEIQNEEVEEDDDEILIRIENNIEILMKELSKLKIHQNRRNNKPQ